MKRLVVSIASVILALLAVPVLTNAASEVIFPSHFWGELWNAKFLNELKAAYETRYPATKVRDINVPISAYFDKLYADVTAGTPPDIATMYDPEIRQYIEADLLEPLDPWLKKAGLKTEDFIPAAKMAEDKGHIYGVIIQNNPRALLYNGRLLKEANVNPPTDLNSFYAALKALRDEKKQQFGFATTAKPGNASLMYMEIMPMVAGFGGSFFRNGKPTATSAETLAALAFHKRIYDEDLIPRGMDTNTYRQMFIEGKIGMYAVGPFLAGGVAIGNPSDFPNLRSMLLPFPGGRTMSITVFLGIPKRAVHKEEAASFLMMMLEEQWQKRVVEIIKALPARKGMVTQDFLRENPWFGAFEKASPLADSYAPQGAESYAPEVIKVVTAHVEGMLFRGVSAQHAAEEMQAELEKLVASKKR